MRPTTRISIRPFCTTAVSNKTERLLHGRVLPPGAAWIASVKGKQPFFAYITPNAAHAPLDVPDEYTRRHAGEVPQNVAKFYGMIENIDENFGRLMTQLDESGLTRNTLVIFLTDNGGTMGTEIFNAGMRGKKVTPYQGGTRVPSFWRWPAGFTGGVDCSALTAQIDVLPTLAAIVGAPLDGELKSQVEGRSLLPLLKDPHAAWADRTLVTHVGRWSRGAVAQAKFKDCSIRNSRYTLVENKELYDLQADPGETTNVIDQHADVVRSLRTAYNAWWQAMLPGLVNEDAVGARR